MQVVPKERNVKDLAQSEHAKINRRNDKIRQSAKKERRRRSGDDD